MEFNKYKDFKYKIFHFNFNVFSLVSGESGSGKTVACNHIVRHLTARSSPKSFALDPRMKHVSLNLSLWEQALLFCTWKAAFKAYVDKDELM